MEIILTEIWKPIKEYEESYEISNFGRIKSKQRIVKKWNGTRTVREKVLTPTDNVNGYLIISLRSNNKRKNKYIHRLVAEAFLDNPENYKYVNHKDYNKKNNNINNLEWCT